MEWTQKKRLEHIRILCNELLINRSMDQIQREEYTEAIYYLTIMPDYWLDREFLPWFSGR
jgi:hypothetical protein